MIGMRTAYAQVPEAQPAALADSIPAAVDRPYVGTMTLSVDATDVARRILTVQEKLPVTPGPLTLLFPEWLPGHHSPGGRVDRVAGLQIAANGKPISWRRDPVNVFAVHVDVPAGVNSLDIAFQNVTPTAANQGRVVMSNDLLDLAWSDVVLYPAGFFARRITVAPTLRVPDGWTLGTALERDGAANGAVAFKPVSLDTLVDSPVFAGRYGKEIDLDPNGRSRVTLNVFADRPQLLAAKPEQIAIHRALVREADKLFGARHYDHYDMLLMLTDRVGRVGLEHHRSSENGTMPDYFTEWEKNAPGRDLLAHEYVHSWNGKFRRPADLWTPDFNTPMRDSLLWVYEGQTQYWGLVLAARSGLLSREQVRDAIAITAAVYSQSRPGRAWRNLQDTTNDPIIAMRRPEPWSSWQRSEDYYSEGLLVWLDADTLIRERSGGRKSLDDFARAFFGIEDGRWTPATYTFDDVVAALNAVEPYDWAQFLRARLDEHAAAPLDGVKRAGYALTFTDTPTAFVKAAESRGKVTDYTYSLGFGIQSDGDINPVIWDSPAFKAGLTTGQRVIAVNGIAYDGERLKEAVKAGGPIDFLVKNGDFYRTVRIDAQSGIRYPRLERVAGTPDRLDDILASRK
jgi:predicted metalloprotease with PDZ domain